MNELERDLIPQTISLKYIENPATGVLSPELIPIFFYEFFCGFRSRSNSFISGEFLWSDVFLYILLTTFENCQQQKWWENLIFYEVWDKIEGFGVIFAKNRDSPPILIEVTLGVFNTFLILILFKVEVFIWNVHFRGLRYRWGHENTYQCSISVEILIFVIFEQVLKISKNIYFK